MMKLALAALILAMSYIGAAAADEQLLRLPTRPGVQQPFWLLTPPSAPVASLILFAGGKGVLNSATRPELRSLNFLVRTRDQFAAQGFLVAVVDAPSDHPEGLDSFRTTPEHAQDIAAVIAELKRRAPVPVWLVSTSMGTFSAANAAARLKPGQGGPDGLVLTSTILAGNRRVQPVTALVDLAAIVIPTFVVHNREDACPLCPVSLAEPLLGRLEHAPRKQLLLVTGGDPPRSDPCEAQSRHGYLGIESEVVTGISRFIKGG
jgi:pimeloyl-ACP methyl ester carboxylesterase